MATPPSLWAFSRALTRWHATHRRDLAVRRTSDPWAILVAEVMSQQTQIERVGPAWERFIACWPDATSLATAGTQELLRAWAGLGYNRRALALREAARAIVRDHGGTVPGSVDELEQLPGLGPYTARAVAASAFGVPVAPLDVNVRRVVGRVIGGDLSPKQLQAQADRLVARPDARDWVDGVMDLAATVCRPRTPRCAECPLRTMCATHAGGAEAAPKAAPAPALRFASTNRWLRGRLLATVREAPSGAWVDAPDVLGEHARGAILAALRGLERDGFLELRDGQARLATDA
ncbi:MAG TPA: A/G-specific adenine glycosylase [Candidatus Limnocylindrales bacterium]|nr:A/G-specific adenine glycosylase [Candidatus Limnocylindrales bacterium]